MTELVVPLTAALDAVDIVDASDIVDATIVATPAKKIFEEFQYQAMTLQGETVEEARTAAEQEFSSAVVDDSNAATAVENIAATTKMSTENDTEIATTIANTSTSTTTTNDNNNDKSSRFVTPKDFELLKVIGMGGALTMVLLALHRIDNNSTLFFLSYLYQHAFSATGSSSLWFVCTMNCIL